MNRPFTCACESCAATDRALVFDDFLAAALCNQCKAKPPAEFLDQRASDWYGPEGRITHMKIIVPPELLPGGSPRRFTGKMYV